MAIRGAVRWKPDVYRSSLSTTVANLDPAATPPSGTIVMTAQLVAYDDAVFVPGGGTITYRPGDPETERNLTILYEETITKELTVFAALTNAQALTEWTTALEDFKTRVLPAGPNLLKAIRSARIASPILI